MSLRDLDLAQLRVEADWIRDKLKLPRDAKLFAGEKCVAGRLHVTCARADGYERYIEAYKCNDKDGEIARQSVEIDRLEKVVEKLRVRLRDQTHQTSITAKSISEKVNETLTRMDVVPEGVSLAHSCEQNVGTSVCVLLGKIDRLERNAIERDVAHERIVAEYEEELQRRQRQMAELRKEIADAKRALPIERGWEDVRRQASHVADGFVPVAAYTDGEEIIVLGEPSDKHDCDVMGCTAWSHVLVRVQHPRDEAVRANREHGGK